MANLEIQMGYPQQIGDIMREQSLVNEDCRDMFVPRQPTTLEDLIRHNVAFDVLNTPLYHDVAQWLGWYPPDDSVMYHQARWVCNMVLCHRNFDIRHCYNTIRSNLRWKRWQILWCFWIAACILENFRTGENGEDTEKANQDIKTRRDAFIQDLYEHYQNPDMMGGDKDYWTLFIEAEYRGTSALRMKNLYFTYSDLSIGSENDNETPSTTYKMGNTYIQVNGGDYVQGDKHVHNYASTTTETKSSHSSAMRCDDAQQSANSQQRTETPQPDLTRLEEYMSVQYRRSDNYRRLLDYLDMELHNPGCCPKDWARYALVIYNSGAMHNQQKPRTFAKWHETFCNTVGCEYIEYKPSQLNLDAHTQAISAYFSSSNRL